MEQDRFAEFAAARWGPLVRAAVVLGCSLHDAEDLAQAALTRCFVKWSQVERADDPDAYAARVLINLHRTSRRRRWWGESPTAVLPEIVVTGEFDDGTDVVRSVLADLSVEHREVVLMRIHLQLSERQTASVLGIAPGTVKSRLSRAVARLRLDPRLLDLLDEHRSGFPTESHHGGA